MILYHTQHLQCNHVLYKYSEGKVWYANSVIILSVSIWFSHQALGRGIMLVLLFWLSL